MKPLGIDVGVNPEGDISFRCPHPSRLEDLIWEAVEYAIDAGVTPKQFVCEVESAWESVTTDRMKADLKEFQK